MRRGRTLLLVLLAATPGPAAAQTLADAEPRPHIAAGTRLDVEDSASTLQVLTRRDIRELPARSVPDALRVLIGLDVRRRGPEGVRAGIGLRGAGAAGTLILVDGEPVSDPLSGDLSAELDFPLDAVERIEVMEGGGAAVYGGGAVGGVVNIVTRAARLGRANAQCETRYAHGSDSLDTGSYRGAGKLGGGFTAAFELERAESNSSVPDTDVSTKALHVTAQQDFRGGHVALSLGYGGRSYGLPATEADGDAAALPARQETTHTRTARLSGELTAGSWTLVPSIFVRAHHDDRDLDRASPAPSLLADTDRFAGRLYARRPFLGGSLAVGAEAGRDALSSSALGPRRRDHTAMFVEAGRAFRLGSPAPEDAGRFVPVGTVRLALRHDHTDGFGTRFSPQLSVSFMPLSTVKLHAVAGTAFRVPTFGELGDTDPARPGNPGLRMERSELLEAGASVDAGPVTLDTTFFRRVGHDVIATTGPVRNLESGAVSGVEASLELDRRQLGQRPLSRLGVQVSYTFPDASAGAALDPLHVKWDLLAGAVLPGSLTAFSRFGYFARPSLRDGVWVWDARLGRQILEGEILEVYAEADNLLGSRYQEQPGAPLQGRSLLAGFHLTW